MIRHCAQKCRQNAYVTHNAYVAIASRLLVTTPPATTSGENCQELAYTYFPRGAVAFLVRVMNKQLYPNPENPYTSILRFERLPWEVHPDLTGFLSRVKSVRDDCLDQLPISPSERLVLEPLFTDLIKSAEKTNTKVGLPLVRYRLVPPRGRVDGWGETGIRLVECALDCVWVATRREGFRSDGQTSRLQPIFEDEDEQFGELLDRILMKVPDSTLFAAARDFEDRFVSHGMYALARRLTEAASATGIFKTAIPRHLERKLLSILRSLRTRIPRDCDLATGEDQP